MKRFFKVLLVIIVLLVAAVFLLPIVFQSEITQTAKTEINKNLRAEVDFDEVSVSLIRSFPDFSVGIDDLTVDGQNEFEGLRMLEMGEFSLTVDLWSVLFGEAYEIKSILIRDADIQLVVDEEGRANYDIVPSGESQPDTAETSTDTASYRLALREYRFENINLRYQNVPGEIEAVVRNFNHQGQGDFTQAVVDLKTHTDIESLSLHSSGVAYLKKVRLNSDFDLKIEQNESRYILGDNHLDLNDLILNFSGELEMPEDRILVNLQFDTPQNSFKSLLSLIPAVYYQDFEGLETRGQFMLTGAVNGNYNAEAEKYPPFEMALKVSDGYLHYPELPAAIDQVNLNLKVNNEEEELDAMTVHLNELTAQIADNPLRAEFHLQRPLSNPDFRAALQSELDLSQMSQVLPLKGYNLQGLLDANFEMATTLEDIEQERYEAVQAEGFLKLNGFKATGDSLPMPVTINSAELSLSPQKVDLQSFEANFGSSDLQANGIIDNIAAYVFSDEKLQGSFSVSSNLLNLNELTTSGETAKAEETSAETDTTIMEVVRLPKNIDFTLAAAVDELRYRKMDIKDVSGTVRLVNGRAELDNLSLRLLEGQAVVSGAYNSQPVIPVAELSLKLQRFSFAESYQTLDMVQELAPIMEHIKGKYSAGLTVETSLNSDMSPELSTLFAEGSLSTSKLSVGGETLNRLADILKNPQLSNLAIEETSMDFTIEDGRLEVAPFELDAGAMEATFSGSSGLDQSLDYLMKMKIPADKVGAADLLERIGAENTGTIPLAVNIGGTVDDPKITTDLGDFGQDLLDQAKEQIEKEVDAVKEEITDKAQQEASELIAEAEKKGDQLIAEAQKRANQIKQEAQKQADRLRAEADKQAGKLESEADSNPLKALAKREAAKKVREEADKKAQSLIDEADRQANKIIQEAKNQKQQLIDEAKAQAGTN